jgi:hypothetical protein
MKSLADSVILAKRKDLIARNQKALHQQSGVRMSVMAILQLPNITILIAVRCELVKMK